MISKQLEIAPQVNQDKVVVSEYVYISMLYKQKHPHQRVSKADSETIIIYINLHDFFQNKIKVFFLFI